MCSIRVQECDLIKDSCAWWDTPAVINRDQEGSVEHVPSFFYGGLLSFYSQSANNNSMTDFWTEQSTVVHPVLCLGHRSHRQTSHMQPTVTLFTIHNLFSLLITPALSSHPYVYQILMVYFHNPYVFSPSPQRNHIPVQIPMKFLHSGMSKCANLSF